MTVLRAKARRCDGDCFLCPRGAADARLTLLRFGEGKNRGKIKIWRKMRRKSTIKMPSSQPWPYSSSLLFFLLVLLLIIRLLAFADQHGEKNQCGFSSPAVQDMSVRTVVPAVGSGA